LWTGAPAAAILRCLKNSSVRHDDDDDDDDDDDERSHTR
jgi:hypothetical protein